MKHKILIHSPNLSTPGGKQNYFDALQSEFKNDVDFFFYGAQGKKESFIGSVKRLVKDYWKFYLAIKNNKYSLVHLNPSLNLKSFFRDSIFTLISTSGNNKVVVFWRGWNWDFERKYVSKILPFFKFTFGKADTMICLANEFSDKLRDYGYKNPVYLETTVVNDKIMKHDFKKFLDAKSNRILFLFLSRVEKVKGIYETLESFEKLREQYGNLFLQIAGTGSELQNLKNLVAEKKIQGVEFLGWLDTKGKIHALSEADIFVFPTYHGEGMPNCVLEAMASGKPVVTTEIGGVKDFFEDGKMGLLVKPMDSRDLKDKLDILLKNPKMKKKIGNYNVSFAKERFASKIVCARLEDIYDATISSNTDYQHTYPF